MQNLGLDKNSEVSNMWVLKLLEKNRGAKIVDKELKGVGLDICHKQANEAIECD